MDEETRVYVEDGQLKTGRRFYLGNNFLTVQYSMERADPNQSKR